MTIEQIEASWREDCLINPLDLSQSALEVPKLHAKYYPLYTDARRKLSKLRGAYKRLKAEKIEFLNNPTEEAKRKHNWEFPDRIVLKSEIPNLLDGDSQLLKIELAIDEQLLVVDFLQDILKQLSQRTWLLKNIQDDRKFMAGE